MLVISCRLGVGRGADPPVGRMQTGLARGGGAGEELWSLDVGGAANQMLTAGANEKVGRRENSMCL